MTTADDFDASFLAEIRALGSGDHELLREIVTTWTGDAPQRLATIDAAIDAGDCDTLHRSAHTLRGSASNLGLLALARTCQELILLAQAGQISGCAEWAAQAREQFRAAERWLNNQVTDPT